MAIETAGQEKHVNHVADLPTQAFSLWRIRLRHNEEIEPITNAELTRICQVNGLTEVDLIRQKLIISFQLLLTKIVPSSSIDIISPKLSDNLRYYILLYKS